MHPRTAGILDHLERHRAALRETVERVPPELRERRPAEGRWSPARVVEEMRPGRRPGRGMGTSDER